MNRNSFATIALVLPFVLALAGPAGAKEGHAIERQHWAFSGIRGQFDKAQLQRGFEIYKGVCSGCHGLKRVNFRNLVEKGGPELPEAAVKEIAAAWLNGIPEANDKGEIADAKGNVIRRAPKLPDPILGPYLNDAAARANQNGALPPDLSVIAKARGVENHSDWWRHVFLDMPGDVLVGYQEGGPDYIYALMTGYSDHPPEGFKLADSMSYNAAFPGNQIAMPQPLASDSSLDQNARDVAAFLAWAADPSHDQRKRIGWQVMLYLLVTTGLLYVGKKRIWSRLDA